MRKEILVVINKDDSVVPLLELFKPENEEDEFVDGVKDLLEKQGRKLSTFYFVGDL